MEHIPLSWEIAGLVALLVLSAFFSIAETAMMAINRYRLKHLVSEGHSGALVLNLNRRQPSGTLPSKLRGPPPIPMPDL